MSARLNLKNEIYQCLLPRKVHFICTQFVYCTRIRFKMLLKFKVLPIILSMNKWFSEMMGGSFGGPGNKSVKEGEGWD